MLRKGKMGFEMNEVILALLIASMIFNTSLNVVKKSVMNSIGPVQASSIEWWLSFFTNPSILLILLTTLGLFAINMWIFSLMSLNSMTAWSWAMGLGAFVLTIFLSSVFLGESFEFNAGFVLILISMVTGIAGAYLF
jgi:hypothetical protein